MKSKPYPFLNSLLAAASMLLATASAQVLTLDNVTRSYGTLIADNFNEPLGNDKISTFNNNLVTTQAGVHAPLSYAVTGDSDWKAQHSNGDRLLVANNEGGTGSVSLNRDFAQDANATDSPLTVSFNIKTVEGFDGDSTRWVQFNMGQTQNLDVANGSVGFSCLFRKNQEAGAAVGTLSDGTGLTAWAANDLVSITFSDTAGTGSAFDGNGSIAKVSVNGVYKGTYTLAQQTTAYFTFSSYNYGGMFGLGTFDSLTVSAGQGVNPLGDATTQLSLINNATLNLGGVQQTIATLDGTAGSIIKLSPGLSSPSVLTVSGSSNSAFAGTITGAGGRLVKAGSGTLTLSGLNSYTGSTIVESGILSLGDGTNNTDLADDAQVRIESGAVLNLNFNGSDTIGSLVINNVSLPNGTYDGSQSTPLAYRNYFTGTGSLTVVAVLEQSGTWISTTNGNWSNGGKWQDTLIASGFDRTGTFSAGTGSESITVTLDTPRTLGTLAFSNANYTISGANTLTLAASATPLINVYAGASATLASEIDGTLGFNKAGPGILALANANFHTGTTSLVNGTLRLEHVDALGSSSLSMANGTTLQLRADNNETFTGGNGLAGLGYASVTIDVNQLTSGNSNKTLSFAPDGFNTWFTTINVTGGNGYTLDLGGINDGSIGTLTLNASSANLTIGRIGSIGAVSSLAVGGSSNAAITGAINTNGGVSKSGTGMLTLSGTNTYNGNTTVNEGALEVTVTGSLRFRPTTNGETNSVSTSGFGTVSYLGTVNLDLGAANIANGNTWTLFNLSNYSGIAPAFVTSTAGSFDKSGTTWTLIDGSNTWTFEETTGVLSLAVPSGSDYDTWAGPSGYNLSGGPGADDDGDGLTNFEEYAFGLIPNSGSSVNPIAVPFNKTAGTFSYTRRAIGLQNPVLSYTVRSSTTLAAGGWADLVLGTDYTESASESGGVETVVVTLAPALLSNPKLFIQIRAN